MADPSAAPGFDALLPPAMAVRAETVGVAKARMPALTLFTLAVLAGAVIALGGVAATVALAGTAGSPWGPTRILAGTVFSLGLVLVVVGGAELFTGNALLVMAWAGGRIGTVELLRHWAIVYAGNLAGAVATALVVYLGRTHEAGAGALGITAVGIATFVAAGFEHSVANLYFVPLGLFLARLDPAFVARAGLGAEAGTLGWGAFLLGNLLPVTLGNAIGGAVLVGLVYWFVSLRGRPPQPPG